jgi:phage FluMu protein gp41
MNITKDQAAVFHYYLERHIHLDGDLHGPMSLRMLEILCDNDPVKIAEAEAAAIKAVRARIDFWDGVLLAIKNGEF